MVQTPRARLFGGIPNATLGACYYPALGLAIWLATDRSEFLVLFLAALMAAGVSVVLAYSLLFVTKMPCTYCWTSHIINWTLAVCTAFLLVLANP